MCGTHPLSIYCCESTPKNSGNDLSIMARLSTDLNNPSAPLRHIFTARKRSLRWLCFYACLSVILFTGGSLPERVPAPGGGCLLPGGSALRGCLLPGGVCFRGCGDLPRWLLLRAVRILLECILV